jgi:hypothetical protein
MRKFNYTGRKKIYRSDFILSILAGENTKNIYFDLDINKSMTDLFNPNSNLVLEAYYRSIHMRFEYGTIGDIKPPPQKYLTAFKDPELILFRIKVINQNGMIEGLADRVKPDREDDESYQESILNVANRDLNGAIWKMVFSDDDINPLLEIDVDIDKTHLNHNVELKASILPHAFRQILTEIIFFSNDDFDFTTDGLDNDWRARWWLFCEDLDRNLTIEEIEEMEEVDKKEWIEETVACFSRKMGFKNELLKSLFNNKQE